VNHQEILRRYSRSTVKEALLSAGVQVNRRQGLQQLVVASPASKSVPFREPLTLPGGEREKRRSRGKGRRI
jgi:hypothetical protein